MHIVVFYACCSDHVYSTGNMSIQGSGPAYVSLGKLEIDCEGNLSNLICLTVV